MAHGASLRGLDSACYLVACRTIKLLPPMIVPSLSPKTCADLHYVSSRFATPFAVAVPLWAQTDLSIKRGLMDSSERRSNRLRRAEESRSVLFFFFSFFFFDIRVCKECKWMNGWLILASEAVDSRKCVFALTVFAWEFARDMSYHARVWTLRRFHINVYNDDRSEEPRSAV